LKGQEMKKKMWTLKLKNPVPRPDVVSIEIQSHKSGYGQTIHIKGVKDRREVIKNNNPGDLNVHGNLALAFFTCPGEIKIDPNFTKNEIHTVVLSYRYKDKEWIYIYISAKNFCKENNYTFELKIKDLHGCNLVFIGYGIGKDGRHSAYVLKNRDGLHSYTTKRREDYNSGKLVL